MNPRSPTAVDALILGREQAATVLEAALNAAGWNAHVADPSHAVAAFFASAPEVVVIFEGTAMPFIRDVPRGLLYMFAGQSTKVVMLTATPGQQPDVLYWSRELSVRELVARLNTLVRGEVNSVLSLDAALPPTLPSLPLVTPPLVSLPEVTRPVSEHAVRSFCLVGADDRIYELATVTPTMLGRGRANQILLNDRSVSRQHAKLQPTATGLRVVDCGSANGLRVNGSAVTEHTLVHGDCLQVGKFVFYVVEGDRNEAVRWRRVRKSSLDSEDTLNDKTFRNARVNDMQGDLRAMDFVTLIQLLVEQRQSGALALSRGAELLGTVYFSAGGIVHAETPFGLSGTAAFYELMTTQNAQFAFRLGLTTPTATITENPTALILEGCRLLDEARSKRE